MLSFARVFIACLFILSSASAWSAYSGPIPAAQETGQPSPLAPEEAALLQDNTAIAAPQPVSPLAGETASLDQQGLLRLISPTGYLDYDEENNMIYSRDRARVEYQGLVLEADRMIFDMNLQEVQAEGNIILTMDTQKIQGDSLRFNFKDKYGAAQNARGQMGVMSFRIEDVDGRPSFQQVSPDVTLIRNLSVTSDDFPIPMYDIRAKEAVILQNERVLLRSATLYVRGTPIFYLPYYSRSLRGAFPWFFRAGSSTQTGVFARLGYSFHFDREAPSLTDDDKTDIISHGKVDVWGDYFAKRGLGAGVASDYSFYNQKHQGHLELYTIADKDRNVDGEEDSQRWQALMHHRSEVGRRIYLQLNTDALSDPEVYYDLLDNFGDLERGRVPERMANAALTMNREQYIARVQMQIKDRIGRDRFSNFSDPNDNNRDFDVEPGQEDKDEEGISTDRWGTTSLKAPEINLATNYLRLARTNFYYRAQLNLFNSLDRGINIVSDDEFTARDSDDDFLYDGMDQDAFVQGADFYNNLMHVYRFNERVTWTNKFGAGVGVAQRLNNEDEDLVDGSRGFADTGDLDDPGTGDDDGYYDGLYFTDERTWHAGWGDELFSYEDINPGFGYADYESRLQARFTDAFTGDVRYIVRGTSEDYIGDWYASQGDQSIRSDLYDFPLRTHWVDGGLNYALAHPDIVMYTRAGRNLVGESELWPNEMLWYYTPYGIGYRSPERTILARSAFTLLEQQYYHPSDPRAFQSQQLRWGNDIEYRHPSDNWWVRLATAWRSNLNESLDDDDDTTLFEEGDSRFEVSPTFATRGGHWWIGR